MGLGELKQTRFYQEAFEEGIEQGVQRGIIQGKQKGKLEDVLKVFGALLPLLHRQSPPAWT